MSFKLPCIILHFIELTGYLTAGINIALIPVGCPDVIFQKRMIEV